MDTTFDVRIWGIDVYRGKRGNTYYVQWKVGSKKFKEPHKTSALADSFRSQLVSATRSGEAFSLGTGRPISMSRQANESSWYDFACAYVDMKWPESAGKSRMGVAETLTTVTFALLTNRSGRPDDRALRRALYGWSFNARARQAGPPSADLARTIRWVESSTRSVGDLADPDVVRAVAAAIGRRLDGKPAAASTAQRKRAVLHNALEYATEKKLLTANPLHTVKLKRNRVTPEVVDRRVVVNPDQAQRLLTAVGQQKGSGPELVAFFACLYYSALRPAEAADLTEQALAIPAEGWGELYLPGSAPTTGAAWSDSGRRRDKRGLKHRAPEATRPVPCPPPLTALLRAHLREHGTNLQGRLFHAARDPEGDLSDSVYGRVWNVARIAALTPQEAASPLARRPYDLRHAAVSTWLNAGVPPTQVAEWAGHSVAVLLRVYAKCLAGQEDAARTRVGAALGLDGGDAAP